jgi:hypothetical protein
MTRLASWVRALSIGDYPRLVAATCLLVIVRIAIVTVPFSRLRTSLLNFASTVAAVVPGTPHSHRVVWAIEAADAKIPGERTCLMRSLTAETLLRLYGYEPEHKIGVKRTGDDGMHAHSWLEHEDDILIGDQDDLSSFDPLPSLGQVDDL